MKLTELQDWLLTEGLEPDLTLLGRLAVLNELGGIKISDDLVDQLKSINWERLLLGGCVLARSTERRFEEAALRIATGAVSLSKEDLAADAGAILFEKLSNRRATKLAETKAMIKPGLLQRLGIANRMDAMFREVDNTILIESSGEFIDANKFQQEFWLASNKNKTAWISASAPTASGKTYVVLRWLLDQLKAGDAKVAVYLAPTRALVAEIEDSLKKLSKRYGLDIEVTSLPLRSLQTDALNANRKIIFVFTQERLHLFANVASEEFQVQLLVVDEAHKVGDRLRGVILQEAQERITRHNPECKVVFLSPATQNPALLLEDAPTGIATVPVDSDTPTVLQNVIFASQVPRKPTQWRLELRHGDATEFLGELILPNRPTGFTKRLAFISAAISQAGGTLIYANGASEAEEIAFLVSQLIPKVDKKAVDLELKALSQLAKKGVHESYQLAPLVEQGVAFHYGNMPTLIRTEIERLFRAGKIKFLVCTSTLIEGVNLSCRTIVLRGPRKGRGKPMNAHDFWNLAGRAGRWGDEFQGNIICIDPANVVAWPTGVPKRTRYPIQRETDDVMKRTGELCEFIERRLSADSADLLKGPQYEQVMAYLLTTFLRDGSLTNAAFAKRRGVVEVAALNASLQTISKKIRIPAALASRHPGVSAASMQLLLDYFTKRDKPVEELLPAPPESDDAYARLIKIMYRVNSYMFPAFSPAGLVPLHALVTIEWMRGLSLAAIISARIRYHKKREESVPLPRLIRDTMELVEQTARFRAPKYIAAYMDVLSLHLDEIGRKELISEEMDFGLMLEFGLSTRTLISLMELGLSRMSAVSLYELIASDSLSQAECIDWVRDNFANLEGLDVPVTILSEVKEKLLREPDMGVGAS
jgi:superfamily II DNA/RNA helicase